MKNKKKNKQPQFRFMLPGDEQLIRLLAFVQAGINAYAVWSQHPAYADAPSIQVMGEQSMREMLAQKVEGKQGTNNPERFAEFFLDMYVRVQPAITDLFQRSPHVVDVLAVLPTAEQELWFRNLAANTLPRMTPSAATGPQYYIDITL